MKNVLVLSSPGGHWVQLCRLNPALQRSNLIYACTYVRPAELEACDTYYKIEDISRDSLKRLPSSISKIYRIFNREKPEIVITTGALPGLIAIIIGKIRGVQTIWLDSIANSENVSMSGRVASYIADDCYTQWEHLTSKRIKYMGRVI